MAYSPKAVANEFIKLAKENEASLTPVKLQKLIYFAHGFSMALLDKELVNEKFQAWQFGPVLKSVYYDFKIFANDSIRDFAFDVEIDDNLDLNFVNPEIPDNDDIVKNLIKAVWINYGGKSAKYLSDLTHKDGTPWAKVYIPNINDIPINNDDIKNYFLSLINVK